MWNKADINKKNTDYEWVFIKVPFALYCFISFSALLLEITSISIERGLCTWVDCNPISLITIKSILIVILAILLVLYILEKWMTFSILGITIISFIILSAHESFGVQRRTGILTLVWSAQLIAYISNSFLNSFDIKKNRIFYPVQVIVACYTLAGLSKLLTTGISWFVDSGNMVLQMIKTQQVRLFDGKISSSEVFSELILFVMQYPTLISLLLLGALLIEISSGLALINKKIRLLYGILLFSMHIGIAIFFHIKITPFIVPMVLFMINPFYLFNKTISGIRQYLFKA